MNFVKKFLLFHLVIFWIPLLIVLVFFNDDKDFCLDSGYCKEGLELNTENGKIVVNEQTCIENNGSWISDKKVCHFK